MLLSGKGDHSTVMITPFGWQRVGEAAISSPIDVYRLWAYTMRIDVKVFAEEASDEESLRRFVSKSAEWDVSAR